MFGPRQSTLAAHERQDFCAAPVEDLTETCNTVCGQVLHLWVPRTQDERDIGVKELQALARVATEHQVEGN